MSQDQQEMDAFFRERGFGRTIGFGDRPVLLVVDLIRAFTNPEMPLGAPLEDQLGATRRLLDEARSHDVPVLFTTVAYDEPDLRDAGVWALKQSGSATLRAGTPEVEIDPRLDRRRGEQLIVKKYASAFFGTDLVSRLNSLRADTLLLAGCTTSGCIRATAVDGLQNGFRVMVVREAVGDRAEAAHTQSLFDLHAKYADVVTLDATLAYLRGERSRHETRSTA